MAQFVSVVSEFVFKNQYFYEQLLDLNDVQRSGLCDGGELKAQMLNSALIPNISTNVELSTKAPLSQNPC